MKMPAIVANKYENANNRQHESFLANKYENASYCC